MFDVRKIKDFLVGINSLKRIEPVLNHLKVGWRAYLWIGGAVLILILCWYLLSTPESVKQYRASLLKEQQPDIATAQLSPPELQENYTFGHSTLGAEHEVECIYEPDKDFLNCPVIVKVVTKPAPGLSQDEARDRAHLAMLKQAYHKSSLREYFELGGPMDQAALEQTLSDERIETSDGEVYVTLPPRNPFTNYAKKAKVQQKLYCRTTKWLTLKAKRRAGC